MSANTFLGRYLSACILTGLLFVTSVFLFMKNDRELDPDYRKSWWTLAFEAPDTQNDMRFIITNHTDLDTFSYIITNTTETLEAATVTVPRGTARSIEPTYPILASDSTGPPAKKEVRVWPVATPHHIFSIYRQE